MPFVVANDKKIRLFKLRKDFIDDSRAHSYENQQDAEGHADTRTTFVERFLKSNGQIIFPGSREYSDFNAAVGAPG